MSTAEYVARHTFRPERYPAIQAVLDDQKPRSLADMVGESILKEIVCGELAAGSRLKSTQLAEKLGVSRTPVAKALAMLAADGILLQPNNHQAIVAEQAADWLIQIHELRELLEPEAAFRAAGELPVDVIDDLWALSRDARPTHHYDYSQAAQHFDFALHLSIAEFCGNLPMKVSIRKCWSYKRLSYRLSDGCRAELRPEYLQHLQIIEAVASGNREQSRSLMLEHLRSASECRFSSKVV